MPELIVPGSEAGGVKKINWESLLGDLHQIGLIKSMGQSYEAESPMQEIRESDIDQIKEKLENCDALVLGSYARTGSSSVLNKLVEIYKDDTKREHSEKLILATSLEEFSREIISLINRSMMTHFTKEQQEPVFIIDESNALLDSRSEMSEKEKQRCISDIKKSIQKAKEAGLKIKFVFQSHDFYGENGEGGVESFKQWLDDGVLKGLDFKTDKMQLENIGQERMPKIFDILSNNLDGQLDELIKRKDEIIALCTTPQQLSKIIVAYVEERASGKEEQEAYDQAVEKIKKDGHMYRSLEDIIRTTANVRMRALLKKVALAPNGSLDVNEFSEEERKIYDRYKMVHFFNEEDGKVSVSGKILEEYVKNHPDGARF